MSKVTRFVDSDSAKDLDKKKHVIDFDFTIYGGAVSWKVFLQLVVALLTTQVEYIILTEAVKKIMVERLNV